MKEIKVWKDPYDAGFEICKKRKIQLEEGLTVLVGCNGTGKSTLIQNIKCELENEKIPFVYYNNLEDGGSRSVKQYSAVNDWNTVATLVSSSEGEGISYNVGALAKKMYKFIQTGKFVKNEHQEAFYRVFRTPEELSELDKPTESKERWILLDAVDSGFSIDNIVDLKTFFNAMKQDCSKLGIELYIIISSNEYELANGEPCFDVYSGKYITFKDYSSYRDFIIKSRQLKDNRYVKKEDNKNNKASTKKNPLGKKMRKA